MASLATESVKTKKVSKKSSTTFTPALVIAKKRDGGALNQDEINFMINGFVKGDVADYQMSALAMAITLRGMSLEETQNLTLAMRDSGVVLTHEGVKQRKVDKHSTGGVGDKVSICLAPIVAACGVSVPMVSGRGLGHTGGTLDKLEALPGFKVNLTRSQFQKQMREVGCALIGQTDEIAPADKLFYALRDVTGTVESIPLITASILSKKLAEGIDSLVLDVKVGRGAFMKTLPEARELAKSIVRVGQLAKKDVTAFLTAMDTPLGRTVGNGLETREALMLLHNHGPMDLKEITFALGAEMLRLGKVAKTDAQAYTMMEDAIQSGRALAKMRAIIKAQGGDPRIVDDPDRMPRAPIIKRITAPKSGFVTDIDARTLGEAAILLGAGRTRSDQIVDPTVGVMIKVGVGERVINGEVIAEVHLRTEENSRAILEQVASAWTIAAKATPKRPLIYEVIRK